MSLIPVTLISVNVGYAAAVQGPEVLLKTGQLASKKIKLDFISYF